VAAPALPLDVELRWATSWAHSADRCVGRHLGFPPLPVACTPNGAFSSCEGPALRAQVEAERRPFVWVDDRAITPEWTAWAGSAAADGAANLLVRPDSASGLTPDDVERIARWLAQTTGAPATGGQPDRPA